MSLLCREVNLSFLSATGSAGIIFAWQSSLYTRTNSFRRFGSPDVFSFPSISQQFERQSSEMGFLSSSNFRAVWPDKLVYYKGVGFMSRHVCSVSTIVVLIGSLSVFAQQNPQNNRENAQNNRDQSNNRSQVGQSGDTQSQANWKSKDHCFATCVALGNQEEIALAEIGKEKASNEDVKMFADMMVRDHHEYLGKLQKFAPEACKAGCLREASGERTTTTKSPNAKSSSGAGGREEATAKANENAAAVAQNEARNADSATSKAGSGDRKSELHEVELELARQCLKSATEKLNEKSGAEFDKCFMSLQISKHMGMKDKLMVYQRHVTGELSEVMAEGLQTTDEHLKKAEKIMKSLESGTVSVKGSRAKSESTADNDTTKSKDEK
ncbi:MAG: hypothetical protein JWM11_2600 [Planctomycetaceae bacterium]|nr:hypothetical protein [Planctomycetaceae bacterium]